MNTDTKIFSKIRGNQIQQYYVKRIVPPIIVIYSRNLKKLVQFSKSTEVIQHRTLDYFNGWRPKQKTKKNIFDNVQHSFTINVASKLGR